MNCCRISSRTRRKAVMISSSGHATPFWRRLRVRALNSGTAAKALVCADQPLRLLLRARVTSFGRLPIAHAAQQRSSGNAQQSHEANVRGPRHPLAEFFERNFPGESRGSVALKGIRYRENLTQKQLAEATGIPQRHISEMEAGKRPIGKETARKLAAVLNCDYRGLL